MHNKIILTYFDHVCHTPLHFKDSKDAPETCWKSFNASPWVSPSLPNISQVEQIVTLRRGGQQVIQGLTYIATSGRQGSGPILVLASIQFVGSGLMIQHHSNENKIESIPSPASTLQLFILVSGRMCRDFFSVPCLAGNPTADEISETRMPGCQASQHLRQAGTQLFDPPFPPESYNQSGRIKIGPFL